MQFVQGKGLPIRESFVFVFNMSKNVRVCTELLRRSCEGPVHPEIGLLPDCECKGTTNKWGFANFSAKKLQGKCI